jgi:16S rRNA (guanine(966)-N(2))-methyltransferase RsmD
VLAGELKGQRLTTPRGSATRPTADRVRIACLDALMPYLPAGAFLDLFAGGGGVGIEALSRGAPSAVFVEQDALALRALRDNIERLRLGERTRVVRADAARGVDELARRDARFAVAFVDPPYDSPRAEPASPRSPAAPCWKRAPSSCSSTRARRRRPTPSVSCASSGRRSSARPP